MYPEALALAKHTGQVRLQRLVRSRLARPVWLVCRLQIPQSVGQVAALATDGFEKPRLSPKDHSSIWRYSLTSENTMSRKWPWSGHCFSITTLPESSKIRAAMRVEHSGQRDCVVLGRPLTRGWMGEPVYVVSGCNIWKSAIIGPF